MESENFKERLIEFARKQYDMGQTNFEAFTGIAPGSINKIRSGISTSSLAKIAERCPELSLRWLLPVNTHERWEMLSCLIHDDFSTSKAHKSLVCG